MPFPNHPLPQLRRGRGLRCATGTLGVGAAGAALALDLGAAGAALGLATVLCLDHGREVVSREGFSRRHSAFLNRQDSRIHAMMTKSREGERGRGREGGRERASERESLLGTTLP